MTDSQTMSDILYGDADGLVHVFQAGLTAMFVMDAVRGDDGVWAVPFHEQTDYEEGAIDRR